MMSIVVNLYSLAKCMPKWCSTYPVLVHDNKHKNAGNKELTLLTVRAVL